MMGHLDLEQEIIAEKEEECTALSDILCMVNKNHLPLKKKYDTNGIVDIM